MRWNSSISHQGFQKYYTSKPTGSEGLEKAHADRPEPWQCSLSLGVFTTELDEAQSSLVWPQADPAVSKRLDQRPPELTSKLNYSVILLWPWLHEVWEAWASNWTSSACAVVLNRYHNLSLGLVHFRFLTILIAPLWALSNFFPIHIVQFLQNQSLDPGVASPVLNK